GFAGPRVIEQTIRQKLPEGFQRSEYLLDKGMVDMVVDRRELKQTLATVLGILMHKRVQAVKDDDSALELTEADAVEPRSATTPARAKKSANGKQARPKAAE